MTPKEVLEHDWKIGEKIWEVCFSYNKSVTTNGGFFCTEKPVGVVEVEVTNIERDDEWKDDWEYIELALNGEFKVDNYDNLPYSDTMMCAMVNHDRWGDTYDHKQFCSKKFFTKKEAESQLKKDVKAWNNRVKQYKENQRRIIEDAKKTIEEAQKNLEAAEQEGELDYKTLIDE